MKTISKSAERVRVFVADANEMACQLMVRALEQSREPIEVVGSASNSVEILKRLSENPSDVAVISADFKKRAHPGSWCSKGSTSLLSIPRIIVLVDSPGALWWLKGFGRAPTEYSPRRTFEMLCKCIRAVGAGKSG